MTAKNVLGQPLEPCSFAPLTGWRRDGCCNTDSEDAGSHTICCIVSDEFLAFSKAAGNDLSTPRPDFGFPGLSDGDRWCVCAGRWEEARSAGFAPLVVLESTNERALEVTQLGHLQAHAAETV